MKKIILALLPALFSIQLGFAQDGENSISLTPIEGGKILTSYTSQLKGYFYGVDLGYQISMAHSDADWARILHVEDIGVVASYISMHDVSLSGSKGLLGNAYGIGVRMDMVIGNIGTTSILVSPGVGFEYLTQTFRTNNNPIVGSHINVAPSIGIGIETPISPSFKIRLMAMASHYSNAAIRNPNASINMLTGSIGFVQNISAEGPEPQGEGFKSHNINSFEFDIGAGERGRVQTGYFFNKDGIGNWLTPAAAKAEGPSDLYQIGMYAGYDCRLSPVFGLKFGTDLVYYTHPFNWKTWDTFFKTYQASFSSYTPLTVGASMGADLWLGRLAFSANYGRYVHSDFLDSTVHTYWVAGLKYYLVDWMAINGKVYFHGGDSGYANFGIVFTLWN